MHTIQDQPSPQAAENPRGTDPNRVYAALIAAAPGAGRTEILALAGIMARTPLRPRPYDVPVAGLGCAELADLLREHFPCLSGELAGALLLRQSLWPSARDAGDEFSDLVALFESGAGAPGTLSSWLARAVATACMGADHLWQDCGLPSRAVLGALLREHFDRLHARNTGDMKWKKFFYRQLCERAQVLACRSPSCSECSDYTACFGPEDAPEPGWLRLQGDPRA